MVYSNYSLLPLLYCLIRNTITMSLRLEEEEIINTDTNVNLFMQWGMNSSTISNNFINYIKWIGIIAIIVGCGLAVSRLLCGPGHPLLWRGHGPPLLLRGRVGECLATSRRICLLSHHVFRSVLLSGHQHLRPGRSVQLGLARPRGAGGGTEHRGQRSHRSPGQLLGGAAVVDGQQRRLVGAGQAGDC